MRHKAEWCRSAVGPFCCYPVEKLFCKLTFSHQKLICAQKMIYENWKICPRPSWSLEFRMSRSLPKIDFKCLSCLCGISRSRLGCSPAARQPKNVWLHFCFHAQSTAVRLTVCYNTFVCYFTHSHIFLWVGFW